MAPLTHNPFETDTVLNTAVAAEVLAADVDRIALQAADVARTVMIGIHGRRRAGYGDTFWQFRRFMEGDYVSQIDWRRSARYDHLYVRENELEHAQTIWLWCDATASMGYCSSLSEETKAARGLLLMFMLADILVAQGERVGIPGIAPPSARRQIIPYLAERMTEDPSRLIGSRTPEVEAVSANSSCVVFSDFLDPVNMWKEPFTELADNGVSMHLVEVLDPSELDFPFSGRIEFQSAEGDVPYTAGRAESLREDYDAIIEAHRLAIFQMASDLGASLLHHRTDHNPDLALAALAAHITEDVDDFDLTLPQGIPGRAA